MIGATLLPFSGALPNTPLDNYYQPNKDNSESKIKLEAVEHGHKLLKHLTEA